MSVIIAVVIIIIVLVVMSMAMVAVVLVIMIVSYHIIFIFIPWILTGLQNPYGYGNSLRSQEVKVKRQSTPTTGLVAFGVLVG
jgi:hypothetical protein